MEGPPGWAEHPLRTSGFEIKLNKWRNSSGALRRLRRQRHIGSSCDALNLLALHHARLLSRSGAAAFGRGTADDAACQCAGPRRRLRRRCHFSQHASLSPFCSKPCTSARLQRCCGLRPHRRLRRQSARPSDALRCCRIRLHWHATTPRPRAIPPNGRPASHEALK